ncbi:MAG: VOC family protein [Candidatus Sulfotelmatobacter sp.]
MITGTHVVFYSQDADADRSFFQSILKFSAVDAGGGWLIFALPPAEAGIHPAEGKAKDGGRSQPGAAVYLMCDDLKAEMKQLKAKKVSCSPVTTERWGIRTTVRLPSGAELGLYQPTHPTAIDPKTGMRVKSTATARSR